MKDASAASQLAYCRRVLEIDVVFLGGQLAPTVVAFAMGSPGHRWPCADSLVMSLTETALALPVSLGLPLVCQEPSPPHCAPGHSATTCLSVQKALL